MKSRARHDGRGGKRLWVHLLVLGAALAFVAAASGATAPAPSRPMVKTGTSSAVTYQSASLNGAVNGAGQQTTYFFQYGPTGKYGSQSLPAGLAADTRTAGVKSPITGLLPQTTYHFRLVAINAGGTGFGSDATFTTTAVPLSLAITSLPNPVALGAPLSLVGALTGSGAPGSAIVLQQNPFPFSGGFQIVGPAGLVSPTGTFRFDLPSLVLTTEFRVVGVGPGEPVVSPTLTEFVQLAVTLGTTGHYTHGAYSTEFSGLIRPAQVGARVSIQRLVAGRWLLVAATSARAAGAGEGSSTYAMKLHLRHSGLYRTYAGAVEGGHVPSTSPPIAVHMSG